MPPTRSCLPRLDRSAGCRVKSISNQFLPATGIAVCRDRRDRGGGCRACHGDRCLGGSVNVWNCHLPSSENFPGCRTGPLSTPIDSCGCHGSNGVSNVDFG